MIRRCLRCGADFTVHRAEDYHCPSCDQAVRALVAADALRRQPRFARAKDLGGMHR